MSQSRRKNKKYQTEIDIDRMIIDEGQEIKRTGH